MDSEITENAPCSSYEISGMPHRGLTLSVGSEVIKWSASRAYLLRPSTCSGSMRITM